MADRKISDLTALTTPAAGDFLPIVDISESAAASKNKRITIEELLRGAPDGTADAPSIAFESDGGNGFYLAGTDSIGASTNGVNRLTLSTTAFTSTLPFVAPLGAAATPSLAFTGDPNTGIYSPGADQLAISTNGVERINVEADGDINIDSGGVFYDATNNRLAIGNTAPSELLHIQGNLTFAGTQSSPALIKANGATDNAAVAIKAGATASEVTQIDIHSGWDGATHVGGRIGFKTANTERARIDDSGRLGLGVSSPTSLLHLADAGDITVGTTTGTKIGTATTQKLGFYNATPVVQPAAVADATTAVDVITQLNDLLAKLRTLGIIAT
jgi:hypothetical protein